MLIFFDRWSQPVFLAGGLQTLPIKLVAIRGESLAAVYISLVSRFYLENDFKWIYVQCMFPIMIISLRSMFLKSLKLATHYMYNLSWVVLNCKTIL
jgi:hypothetical protein